MTLVERSYYEHQSESQEEKFIHILIPNFSKFT